MYCPSCGESIPDNVNVCPSCDAWIGAGEPAGSVEPASVNESKKNEDAKNSMIIAIIGIAISESGIPGIILSSIAKKKVREYNARYDEISGMAKTANILSKIAFPISIVATVYWAIYITVSLVSALLQAL